MRRSPNIYFSDAASFREKSAISQNAKVPCMWTYKLRKYFETFRVLGSLRSMALACQWCHNRNVRKGAEAWSAQFEGVEYVLRALWETVHWRGACSSKRFDACQILQAVLNVTQARHENLSARASPSQVILAEQSHTGITTRILHIYSPSSKLPKYSKMLGASIKVEVLPFPCHQAHRISSYSDIILFWEPSQ